MAILENLDPQSVFGYFEQLCAIPHGSYNTKPLADWLEDIAVQNKLEYIRDAYDNVIIKKSASDGYENHPSVILQGHTDMVCEKSASVDFDFEKDSLKLKVCNDTVSADRTTLGADNGIAVAMMLAILTDNSLKHPAIEALFTSNEEVGMLGATALDCSVFKSKIMINMDSDDEGIFTVGCAGGNVTECIIPVTREPFEGSYFSISVSGLKGGHSGVEINKGRANADILLVRLIAEISVSTDTRLVCINGGNKDNAIPCESSAVIAVKDSVRFISTFNKMTSSFSAEFGKTEPGLKLTFSETTAQTPMDKLSTQKSLCLINVLPNGVQEMDNNIQGLVRTSLNLGILKTDNDKISASYCVRSSIDSQKNMINRRLTSLTEIFGGQVIISGDYPAWEYNPESKLRDLIGEVYNELYGCYPKYDVIHAGLECGIIASGINGLDCISVGAELNDIHTDRESFSISSVQRLWKLIIKTLEKI